MADKMTWIFYDSFSKAQSNPVSTEDAQLAIFKMSTKDTERFFIWTTGWEKWQPLKAYLESKQQNFASSFTKYKEQEETQAANNENTIKAEVRDATKTKSTKKKIDPEATQTGQNTISKSFSLISLNEETIEAKNDYGFDEESFDGDDISLSGVAKPNMDFTQLNKKNALDSRADRHELKIEILLISHKGKTFRSKSKNISLSGSLLEDSIPFDYCETTFDIVVINKQPCDPKFQRVPLRAKTVGDGLTQRIFYVDVTPKQKMALQNLLQNYLSIQGKLKKTG